MFSLFIYSVVNTSHVLNVVSVEEGSIGEIFLGSKSTLVVGSAYMWPHVITSQRNRFQGWPDYISSLLHVSSYKAVSDAWDSHPTNDIGSLPSAHRETTFITWHVWRCGSISPSSAYIPIDIAYKITSVQPLTADSVDLA
jgi:hypothetical protein